MWSSALDVLLTTLRYLAPATLLTLFWGQQSFLFKILKHIDSAFRAIVFSSEEQKQEVLQWLAEAGSVRVEHLETVWRHGWILCGVLDATLPGACAGHPPTRLSLKHAQAIADHYLGVEPVFSRQELDANDSLSRHQEWKLATYLDRIRQALAKLTPPVSKPTSQRTSPETSQFTFDYVAKGSGLTAAQINNKINFKIYPTTQQALDPGEITILFKGPKDTYGMTVLPPILGKAQLIRQKLLGLQSKLNYTENILPITQGVTYLRSFGKNDMNKTYYIPKTKYDIEIEVDSRPDHAKISYIVNLEGKYEISITSRGQNIVGSPFTVTASNNIIKVLERDSFCLEDGEEIDIVDVKTDRKAVLRIVDFVTEKMLLKENGILEKISDNEAKLLMASDGYEKYTNSNGTPAKENKQYLQKFYMFGHKILIMNRICKIFNNLVTEKQANKNGACISTRNQQDIPDIVNSTLCEPHIKSCAVSEKRDRYIIPESISVSLRTEKSKPYHEEEVRNATVKIVKPPLHSQITLKGPNSPDSLDKYKIVIEEENEDDNISLEIMTTSRNPFTTDMSEDSYITEKDLGTFVTSEYETNNSQNEETRDSSINILIESNDDTPSPINNNPFLDDILQLERPKTPVLKIITGQITDRDDSVYVNPKSELMSEEHLANEFLNPFFIHQHQLPMTDFIIGAPVSLPPIIKASSPEPDIKLMDRNEENLNNSKIKNDDTRAKNNTEQTLDTACSSNLEANLYKGKQNNVSESSAFHSLESNLTETTENSNSSTTSDNQYTHRVDQIQSDRNLTPKRDIWDSAYVSIDDSNSSPDTNNNENATICETVNKQKFPPSGDSFELNRDELSNMGPAEREIWQTCSDLKYESPKIQEEPKLNKWELKRPVFTPIIEESDRSISSGMKDVTKTNIPESETDSVTVAFAELNEMYKKYFSNSECSNAATVVEDLQSMEVNYTKDTKGVSVDSASEILSDVKRHEKLREGTISEVQANVTESVSVSHTLHDSEFKQSNESFNNNKDETQFGDSNCNNIVLEKKKYWDEKIRQIQAKTDETTCKKKKRVTSKQLKHNDSLSKRKGKQIVKNFLIAGEHQQSRQTNTTDEDKNSDIITRDSTLQQPLNEQIKTNEKFVNKWRKYWNDKLEMENDDLDEKIKTKPSRNNEQLTLMQQNAPIDNTFQVNRGAVDSKVKLLSSPIKHELPEEVFKAFETSPKRFFGTSRKHILNKIDTFLGNPSFPDNSSVSSVSVPSQESGLVSSRISLFHNLSNTEELPWVNTKCKSQHNIYQSKESEKSGTCVKDELMLKENKDTYSDTFERVKYTETEISRNNDIEEKDSEIRILKEKRAKMLNTNNKSFDDPDYSDNSKYEYMNNKEKQNIYVKNVSSNSNKSNHIEKYINKNVLRRTSISKSEMDIFNKVSNDIPNDYPDKYKSCDELPKTNVRNFISLYESVSRTVPEPKPVKRMYRTTSTDSQKYLQPISTNPDAVRNNFDNRPRRTVRTLSISSNDSKGNSLGLTPQNNESLEIVSLNSVETISNIGSVDIETHNENKETTYLSLSDIELEIIETCPEKSSESSPERTSGAVHLDYKSRFHKAKQFFQSLEELRDVKKPVKLNECELLLYNKSNESLETSRPQRRVKKNIKSHSMPASEISKIWNQLQCTQDSSSTKLVKISEKFNVEDLFADVMEGKLSRQGSLRGIPHKKAVLEAFRSMENITDNKLNSYELAESHLSDFAKEHTIKNAQTYLREYPYLPTTDPSKYHSRLDIKASGLIPLKELLQRKPRRNSVPDLRLNPKFTVDL